MSSMLLERKVHVQEEDPDADLQVEEFDGEDLVKVPEQFLSGDTKRPLKFTDARGNVYTYYAKPMFRIALFVLIQECLERFVYYGVNPLYADFLTDPTFAGWTAAEAAATHTTMNTLGYLFPLLSAVIADSFGGVYRTILVFSAVYLAALILLTIMGVPELFQTWQVKLYFYFLFPCGFGGIKSLINVIGADQFHPILQRKMIEQFYLLYYMSINVGGLAGGFVIPILYNNVGDQKWKAFVVCAAGFFIATVAFIVRSGVYVKKKPLGSALWDVIKVSGRSVFRCPPSLDALAEKQVYTAKQVSDTRQILKMIPLLAIVAIPFNMAYGLMGDFMVYQGNAMDSTGGFQGNLMSNFDSIGVLFFGFVFDRAIFPYLRKINRYPDHMTKAAIGSFFGLLAVVYLALLNYRIQDTWNHTNLSCTSYDNTGECSNYIMKGGISIFALLPGYFLIAIGEIFCNVTSLEVAYLLAPQQLKGTASAISLLMVGTFPNLIYTALEKALPEFQQDKYGCGNQNGCPALAGTNGNPEFIAFTWDYQTVPFQYLYFIFAAFPLIGMILPFLFKKQYYALVAETSNITAEFSQTKSKSEEIELEPADNDSDLSEYNIENQ